MKMRNEGSQALYKGCQPRAECNGAFPRHPRVRGHGWGGWVQLLVGRPVPRILFSEFAVLQLFDLPR